jgi:hypothetical protein
MSSHAATWYYSMSLNIFGFSSYDTNKSGPSILAMFMAVRRACEIVTTEKVHEILTNME